MSAADQMGKIQLTYEDGVRKERVRCLGIVEQSTLPGSERERIARAILEGKPATMNEDIKVIPIDDQDATGIGKSVPADEQKVGDAEFKKAAREIGAALLKDCPDPDALPGTIAAARRPPWPQGHTAEDITAASFKLAGVEKPDKAPDRFRVPPSKFAPGCTCMLCEEDRQVEAHRAILEHRKVKT